MILAQIWTETNNVLYLDFSKAFDKLQMHDPNETLLQWFENYLNERWQRVVIEGVASAWSPVTSGALQGSILGPLLFSCLLMIFLTMYRLAPSRHYMQMIQSCTERYDLKRNVNVFKKTFNQLEKWSNESRMRF